MRASGLFLLLLAPLPGAAAQAWWTLGGGVGTVRFEGGSQAAVGTVSPVLSWVSPGTLGWAGLTGALLPGGALELQGSGELQLERPVGGPWRVGADLVGGGTEVSGGDRTGDLGALGELVWRRGPWGIAGGLGTTAGWIVHEAGVASIRGRLRAWWYGPDAGVTAVLEPTRLLGAWYTDVTVTGTALRGPVSLTATLSGRVASPASAGAASLTAQVTLSPQWSLLVAGGSVLAEPYQGFPRASFFNVGMQLSLPARPRIGRLEAARAAVTPPAADGSVTARFHLSGDSLQIAGDWNGWKPEPLERVGPKEWRLVRALAPGVYRFSLRTADGQWIVPPGYAVVTDDLGGKVAVLVVP